MTIDTLPAEPTIFDIITDPNHLARWFKNTQTYKAWFSCLALLFGLELTPEQRAIAERCTGRTTFPAQPFREAYLCAGRRSGKSFFLALIGVSGLLSGLEPVA